MFIKLDPLIQHTQQVLKTHKGKNVEKSQAGNDSNDQFDNNSHGVFAKLLLVGRGKASRGLFVLSDDGKRNIQETKSYTKLLEITSDFLGNQFQSSFYPTLDAIVINCNLIYDTNKQVETVSKLLTHLEELVGAIDDKLKFSLLSDSQEPAGVALHTYDYPIAIKIDLLKNLSSKIDETISKIKECTLPECCRVTIVSRLGGIKSAADYKLTILSQGPFQQELYEQKSKPAIAFKELANELRDLGVDQAEQPAW